MNRITAAGATLGVLLWSGAARAQGPGPRGPREGEGGPGFGPPIGMLAERLGLSDDQKAQIKALREKSQEANEPLFDAARKARQALDKALEADSPDVTTIGQLALAMHAAQKKVDAAQRAAFEEMKSILTPEQLEKLEQGPRGFGPGQRRPQQ